VHTDFVQMLDKITDTVNLHCVASYWESLARKLIRPIGDLTEKDVQNEIRAIKKLCQDHSNRNLVSVLRHGQFFAPKLQLAFFYIDMELCDFDLHAAIQNRRLLSQTRTDADSTDAAATAPEAGHSTLKDMLSREQELECMMKMLSDITSGVVFMHELGEVHRDLKPHNGTSSTYPIFDVIVLYRRASGCWKIADFGMTVEGSSTRGRTTNLRRGTPCYRAPELFDDIPIFTKKVDIFAIGCITFEFMTGRKAFSGDLAMLKYAAGKTQLDFSPSRFRTTVNDFLESLTRQLLSVQVEERPSAKTLLRKLSKLPGASKSLGQRIMPNAFNYVVSDDKDLTVVRGICFTSSVEVHEVTVLRLYEAYIVDRSETKSLIR
jgi:serine/threonine protein kinase